MQKNRTAKVSSPRLRETHPYQRFEHQGVAWEYVASGPGPEVTARQALLVLGGGLSMGESAFQTILHLEGNNLLRGYYRRALRRLVASAPAEEQAFFTESS